MREKFVIASRSRISRIALVSLLGVAGCRGPECVVNTTQYTTAVNTVGYAGPTLGMPVARFDLTQDFVTHTPYEACAQGPLQDVGVVRLKVTSTAPTPLAIQFDVQGLTADGIMAWSQVGVIQRIAPNETVDVGAVFTSPTHVDVGARVILTSVTIVP